MQAQDIRNRVNGRAVIGLGAATMLVIAVSIALLANIGQTQSAGPGSGSDAAVEYPIHASLDMQLLGLDAVRSLDGVLTEAASPHAAFEIQFLGSESAFGGGPSIGDPSAHASFETQYSAWGSAFGNASTNSSPGIHATFNMQMLGLVPD